MSGLKIKLVMAALCASSLMIAGVVNANSPSINIRTKMAYPVSDGCKSSWGHSCEVLRVVEADPGYVVCHILGNGYGGRGAEFNIAPSGQLSNDPSKYAQVRYAGVAHSNVQIWNAWGSQVGFNNMGIIEISMDASASDRHKHGCDV